MRLPDTIKLLDEIYIIQKTVSPGGIFNHIKMYFHHYDPESNIVYVTLDKEGKRRTLITARAIDSIRDSITGELKYQSDPRNIVLGNNL